MSGSWTVQNKNDVASLSANRYIFGSWILRTVIITYTEHAKPSPDYATGQRR